ncbi:hypothetical protein BN1058_02318 [Paraliobacillus sp. PM-2]|uniref:hypothetical protein n=1 Tax=Paraliobacillus sp. PM-2 TaxID=1462524 RepID=UPI00061C379F|nr:hypothetical protein [Paraliobacillus sp. PM-2]CQR47981.1 hypothetical protein BN1058_02318 [Paraliobacillus sp. PM-2]
MNISRFLNNVAVIAKHLERNEKYFRYPEKKVMPTIKETEKLMHSFEKEITSWERYFK